MLFHRYHIPLPWIISEFVFVDSGFELLLNFAEHRETDRLFCVGFDIFCHINAFVDGPDVIELPEELKDFRIGSGKTRFHGRFDFVGEGNRRSEVKMIVKSVDELFEEGRQPAILEPLQVVTGEDHDHANASAGFAYLVINIPDGVESDFGLVVAVAEQMGGFVDDEYRSGIVDKILDYGGFGHVL